MQIAFGEIKAPGKTRALSARFPKKPGTMATVKSRVSSGTRVNCTRRPRNKIARSSIAAKHRRVTNRNRYYSRTAVVTIIRRFTTSRGMGIPEDLRVLHYVRASDRCPPSSLYVSLHYPGREQRRQTAVVVKRAIGNSGRSFFFFFQSETAKDIPNRTYSVTRYIYFVLH